MRKRKAEIGRLIGRLTDRAADLEESSVARKKFRSKVITLFENDLDEGEKHLVVEYLLEELSYKTMIEHPEFLHKQTNAKLKPMLFGGVIALILIFASALFFSDADWIKSINAGLSSLFYKMGLH